LNLVIVGVGSNINPQENVQKAKELISQKHTIVKSSRFIKTKPIGYKDQADFLNGGWLVETSLSQRLFKLFLNGIEKKLGRVRTDNKSGPRTIDLDVVIWNGEVVDNDYYERDFLQTIVKDLDKTILLLSD
jgi:2-amino-4-hydroxy-6-hydroxymethyldihydropteridine diphosphokinase